MTVVAQGQERTGLRPWTAAVLLVGIAASGCSQEGRFAKACEASTNLSPEVCECAARRAKETLSADAMSFVIATLEKDGDRARSLGENLTLGEAAKAGTFMVTTPARCMLDSDTEE